MLRIRGSAAHHPARHGRRRGAAGDPAGRHRRSPSPCARRATTSTSCTASWPPRASSPGPTTSPACATATPSTPTAATPTTSWTSTSRRACDAPDTGAGPELLHLQLLRRLRQGQHRRDPHEDAATTSPPTPSRLPLEVLLGAARPAARRAAGVRARPAACTRPGCSPRTASWSRCARTSGRHNAVDKVIGDGVRGGPAAAGRARADGERPGELRADPEGGDGRHPGARRGVGAVVPGGGAGRARSASRWSASCAATAATSTRARSGSSCPTRRLAQTRQNG